MHYSNDNEQVIYEAEIKSHYKHIIFINITITVGFGYFKRKIDFFITIVYFQGFFFCSVFFSSKLFIIYFQSKK